MTRSCVLGVDIGTSSTKGVLVDASSGEVIASTSRAHEVNRPRPGWVEMDADTWWDEFGQISTQLLQHDTEQLAIIGVGVSGMGPCVLLADEHDQPTRPAILYGVDTRATAQIEAMTADLTEEEIIRVGGSRLTTQAAGPKVKWIRDEEPAAYDRAIRLFMPASWLVRKLTGAYVLDHQSASQCSPFYDVEREQWHDGWWQTYATGLVQPRLSWAGEIAGTVTPDATAVTGIPVGTPVITGTIDAWTEAVSVGAHEPGDLMLMYGTTMFLIATGEETLRTPSMWTTVGAFPGTRNLAGGLATSGALTAWLKQLTGADYPTLLSEAGASAAGCNGLVMLPYFAGERTPILDPDARGVIAGLTLSHSRGDIYRAALEATAFGVRHNVETMRAAGADITRIVAVGGGTQGNLWLQIVSDVTGLPQQVPHITIGASYGAAFMAAAATAATAPPAIEQWNPVETTITPDPAATDIYNELFALYLDLYTSTKTISHDLAARQRQAAHRPASSTADPSKETP